MPAIGVGTWHVKPHDTAEVIKTALQEGYRHIDTAYAYGNEKEVGEGIRTSGIPRDDIWITTKVGELLRSDDFVCNNKNLHRLIMIHHD